MEKKASWLILNINPATQKRMPDTRTIIFISVSRLIESKKVEKNILPSIVNKAFIANR